MSTLITPELKDVVLRYLIDKCEFGYALQVSYLTGIENIQGGALVAILDQFKRKGLISMKSSNQTALVHIEMEAHDFIQQGGFYG